MEKLFSHLATAIRKRFAEHERAIFDVKLKVKRDEMFKLSPSITSSELIACESESSSCFFPSELVNVLLQSENLFELEGITR